MIDHDNLEEFADPRTYDLEDSSDTGVAFYTALAWETGGPVLELACGTGRVSIPIARLGFAVTGLDIVPGMVELARSKSVDLPARWVTGDARAFDLRERSTACSGRCGGDPASANASTWRGRDVPVQRLLLLPHC